MLYHQYDKQLLQYWQWQMYAGEVEHLKIEIKISSKTYVTRLFPKFVPELWPFIYAKISFPLNIMRKNWHMLPNFIYALNPGLA